MSPIEMFSADLKRFRELNGYDAIYVATRLKVTREYYSRMENGKANISIKVLQEIAIILNAKLEIRLREK